MALIVPSRRIWTGQPQYPVGVNTGNSLTRDIVTLWTPVAHDVARNRILTLGSSQTVSASRKGRTVTNPLASTGGTFGTGAKNLCKWTDTSTGDGTGDFTVLVFANPVTNTTRSIPFAALGNGNGAPETYMTFNGKLADANASGYLGFSGSSQAESATSTAIDGDWHVFVFVRSTAVFLYRDGVDVTGNTTPGIGTALTEPGGKVERIGGYSSGSYGMNGRHIALTAGWTRALSAAEIAQVSNYPWSLFQPANSPIFYSLPAAGGAHTLSGAVVESTQDSASGTASFVHTLAGAVVESATDTAAGTISFTHTLDGAVVEDGADTAAGTITSAEGTFLSGAVVEDGEDTAAGTISYLHTLDGAAVEDGADTATGTILGTSALSGAVVESTQDSATGGIDNLEAVVPVTQRPAGGGKAGRQKRRRVVIDDELYDVPERDLPALLEAKLANKRPPSTAELIDDAPAPEKPRKGGRTVAQSTIEPVGVQPSLEEAQARYEAILAGLNAQAQADVRQMLERVAVRVLAEIEDEEDSAIALLMA